MEEPIEQGGDRGGVAEQLAPVVDRAIGRQHRGRAFIAPHDQLEEILGGGVRELAHAEVVDDEQRDGGQFGQERLPRAIDRGLGDLLQQRVSLAVGHAIALLDRGAADRLGEMAFARAGRAEKQGVFALLDEARGREIEDRARGSSSC